MTKIKTETLVDMKNIKTCLPMCDLIVVNVAVHIMRLQFF